MFIRKFIIPKAKDTAPLNEKQFLYHTNFEGCLIWLFVNYLSGSIGSCFEHTGTASCCAY